MAGPTISSLLQKAGIAPGQTVGTQQAIDDKKDADPIKIVLDGDDGEVVKSISEAAAKASKNRATKPTKGDSTAQGDPVRRRKVKLKDLARRVLAKQVADKKQAAESREVEREPVPETPKAKARRGLQKAAGKLGEQGRCREIQVRFETARSHQEFAQGSVLSRSGQQKWMLTNLCGMLRICVEQHTGGLAGEVFESRRDTRIIYMALRGLNEGERKSEPGDSPALSAGELRIQQKRAQYIFSAVMEPPVRPQSMPEYYEVA